MSRSKVDRDMDASVADGAMRVVPRSELIAEASKLKGRVVVVTGGASGFGRAYAIEASKHGARVVVGDLDSAGLAETLRLVAAAGGTARGRRCDVTSWDDQVALFSLARSEFGSIDVAIANAGISDTSQGQFLSDVLTKPDLTTIDVDLTGVIYTARIALHHLRENPTKDGKAIVLVGSFACFYGGPLTLLYATAKHGVLGFTRSLKFLCAQEDINCTMIAPYYTDTPIMKPMKAHLGDEKLGTVAEVVDALVYASTAGVEKLPPGQILLTEARGVFVTVKNRIHPLRSVPRL